MNTNSSHMPDLTMYTLAKQGMSTMQKGPKICRPKSTRLISAMLRKHGLQTLHNRGPNRAPIVSKAWHQTVSSAKRRYQHNQGFLMDSRLPRSRPDLVEQA